MRPQLVRLTHLGIDFAEGQHNKFTEGHMNIQGLVVEICKQICGAVDELRERGAVIMPPRRMDFDLATADGQRARFTLETLSFYQRGEVIKPSTPTIFAAAREIKKEVA
ncbi:MAG: hypothetical protein LBD30_07965 [Verrucomicrobiales bacterium]|nr:hypothetical protein [Verrucomicrobiales bacterium]